MALLMPWALMPGLYGSIVEPLRLPAVFRGLVLVVLFQIFELLIGRSNWNPDVTWSERWGQSLIYRIVPMIWAPLFLVIIFWNVAILVHYEQLLSRPGTALAFIGLMMILSTRRFGANIVAHELMHGETRLQKALAAAVMTASTYPHFCIEHIHGHHARVATSEDPATARRGESLYRFLPRTIVGTFKSAWAIEARRMRRQGFALWSHHNRMLRYSAAVLVMYAAAAAVFGPAGVLVLALQSGAAIVMLEATNYIEHYGLARQRTESGRYEGIKAMHSWDTPYRLSNALLLNLGRHSDHHLNVRHNYQTQEAGPDAPRHPLGHGAMILLAAIPPAWFALMDRRIDRWRSEGITNPSSPQPAAS